MVKVSSNKRTKRNSKRNRTKQKVEMAESSAVNPQTHDDEEEYSSREDEDVNSEEDESDDERKRQKLLEAISSIGGKKKHSMRERSETAVNMSEFTVNTEGEAEKVDLSDLIGTVNKTNQTKIPLKTLQQRKKPLDCPLSKQERVRIQRDVGFQKAASEVSRWQSVITQFQRAEQLVFPLKQESSSPRPMERVVTGWKAQSPLEQEIFALLSANKQPITDVTLTPAEEASLKAMNLEEVKIRRAELQKARALQSYYEAKARREKKIKSKKYHKVQNKAKKKDFLKQFDQMVKTDPAAALEELNKMELARMQERMSLKHQNSGKWAKSKAIMAKYDKEARRAMQQQLEVNKDLSQKLVTSLNDEEDEEEEEAADAEMLPDFVNDAEHRHDSANPWMRGKLSEEPAETVTSNTVSVTVKDAEDEKEVSEVDETEEEALLREFDSRRKQRQVQGSTTAADGDDEEQVTGDQTVEDSDEEQRLSELKISRSIKESLKENEAANIPGHESTSAQLEEGLMRIRTLEDMDLLPQETPAEAQQAPTTEPQLSAGQQSGKSRKRRRGIELKEVLTKETTDIKVPFSPTVTDSEEKLDQRGLIKEAFAGDDVVSDFLKEKRKLEDAGKPKTVDLTLPGWGEWGGVGLKPSSRKRRKFRIKTEPPPSRKDQHLPSVIISEKRNSAICPLQVNSLPFPFQNPEQFENCISSPLGRMWNTERTVKKITKAKVVTRLGAIIEPMAEEELLKDKKNVSAGRRNRVKTKKTKQLKQSQ